MGTEGMDELGMAILGGDADAQLTVFTVDERWTVIKRGGSVVVVRLSDGQLITGDRLKVVDNKFILFRNNLPRVESTQIEQTEVLNY